MSTLDLADVEIDGIDDHPANESVRLHGPPGCGKTTQSAARVARLIQDHGYEIGDVAWATYRRSLAVDTLTRLAEWDIIEDEQLDDPAKGDTRFIGTTHAIANRSMSDLPAPADGRDRIDFCDKRDLRYKSRRPWEDGIGELLFEAFSWLKRNRLDPSNADDVRQWSGYSDLRERWDGDISAVWRDWEDYKAQRDLIDYYEMLERPLEQGTAPPCPVLVVDEYHDATPLMAALSEMWADAAEVVIVAGDPHQVVNAYDGADPMFFEQLDYPKVLLDTTYRVPEENWRLATTMLAHAHSPPPVERTGGGYIDEYLSPEFRYDYGTDEWTVPDPGVEAAPVWLHERYDGNTLYLTRTKMQAAGVARALDKAGVIYGSQADIVGWNAGSDRLQLHNALQRCGRVTAADFQSKGGITQYTSSGIDPASVELPVAEAITLLEYTDANYLAQSRTETVEIAHELRSEQVRVSLTNLDEYVEQEFWEKHTAGAASVGRLLKGQLDDNDRRALRGALERYDSAVEPGEQTAEVMTVHASKGKGATNVVVYDGTSPRAAEEMQTSDAARDNEYRTWYVALTRASKRLCIMRSAFDWTVPIIPEHLEAVVSSGGGAIDANADTRSASD